MKKTKTGMVNHPFLIDEKQDALLRTHAERLGMSSSNLLRDLVKRFRRDCDREAFMTVFLGGKTMPWLSREDVVVKNLHDYAHARPGRPDDI